MDIPAANPTAIPPPVAVYKLEIRFTFRKMNRTYNSPTNYWDQYTQEQLSVEDSIDLTEAKTLTAVLAKIDAIHQELTNL